MAASDPYSDLDCKTGNLYTRIQKSIELATNYAWDICKPGYHWNGELKSNTAITSQQIFFYQSLGITIREADEYRQYLLSQQQSDGSWSIAPDYPGDLSITAETYLALKILDVSPLITQLCDKERLSSGNKEVSLDDVPQLPAEFIFLPSALPLNIYRLSSWARSTLVPLFIIRHHEKVYALPNGMHANNTFLDELWLDPQKKNIPYGPLLSKPWESDAFSLFFGAVDTTLSVLGKCRPLWIFRGLARKKCIQWILDHQEKEGDWAGIIPPMHAGIQALILEGYSLEDDCVRRGIEAIERFTWHDKQGKRLQSCVSPVWDTVLMTRALCDAGADKTDPRVCEAIKWIKSKQILSDKGDWRVFGRSFGPGGFSFEYNNDWYPDVDDTAAAILAVITHDPVGVGSSTVARAVTWICGMQNRDGGWGAFDIHNDKLWLNKIPFSDMDALCDPSSADVTGRILEAFGLMMEIAKHEFVEPQILDKISKACSRAVEYLAKQQEDSGAWYGRWGCNYLYGTSNVICGLAYFSEGNESVQGMLSTATSWLKKMQNLNGGWGEDLRSYQDPSIAGHGPSTASQTAWALMGLLVLCDIKDESVKDGITYLLTTQTDVQGIGASWPEFRYTGTGFPNHFYIGYSLYRHYFPLMVLGRYLKAVVAK
ncbi:hypothetical protein N0V90_000423 [Kalmusia sp. IMI 367209]|nr:hypothetical protein N0V90_000423 [Kalmusia sp. IMI 367209]